MRSTGLSKYFAASALALTLIAAGCSGTSERGTTASPPTDDGNVYYGTEIAISECPISLAKESPFLAIAGAVVSSAIAQGVDRIGTALEEAAKKNTAKVFTARNVQVTADALDNNCVTIVRGWYFRHTLTPICLDFGFKTLIKGIFLMSRVS